jgi:hypothetical protein
VLPALQARDLFQALRIAYNGLAWIDPAHIVRNVVPPPISILSIGNEKGRQTISNAVKFAARTHTVEIDYTALSLSIPERVEFRYKLEGVDAGWQNVGTKPWTKLNARTSWRP